MNKHFISNIITLSVVTLHIFHLLDLPAPFKQAHTKFLSHVADLELYIGSVVARRSAKQNKDDERRFEIPVLSVAKSKWSEV